MRISRTEPGYAFSAAVHFGLLAMLLVSFSHQQKFDDAQEAVPVETITDAQFHEIMKGSKSEKKVADKPKVDRIADLAEQKPTPPTPEAKRDIPTPPPPMKKLPDPSEAEDKPTPPTPPVKPPPPVPMPPIKPPPQEAREELEDKEAEPIKPPTKPKPPEKKVETKPEPPKPPEKPKPKPPKLDEVAKLLSQNKDKPSSKPKSGEESNNRPSPNLAEISKLLSHEAPQSRGASGRELSKVASLGAPTATGARMSPSLSQALNGWFEEQYKGCWSYLALSNGPKYVARIRVFYRPDGSLSGEPVLTNPSNDPAARSLADSALRAVRRCNPLKVPAQFQPYYQEWKSWLVGFDPEELG